MEKTNIEGVYSFNVLFLLRRRPKKSYLSNIWGNILTLPVHHVRSLEVTSCISKSFLTFMSCGVPFFPFSCPSIICGLHLQIYLHYHVHIFCCFINPSLSESFVSWHIVANVIFSYKSTLFVFSFVFSSHIDG